MTGVTNWRSSMKILVAFYSRSGKTKKVAEAISEILKCDKEEIFDIKSREGIRGFLSAGSDANLRRLTAIKEIKNNPSLYDLVIIGTPIWSSNISTPIRTYLSLYKEDFKKVAFFCTRLGSDSKKIFGDMKNLSQKTPLALLELNTREVARDQYTQKVKEFIENLKEELKK
jgi:flavodoxin